MESLPEVYPQARWQRCVFHFHRNILNKVSRSKREDVGAMLRAIQAQESQKSAKEKAHSVAEELLVMKLPDAAKILLEGIDEATTYVSVPNLSQTPM